jgi:CHAT domain-containing protein
MTPAPTGADAGDLRPLLRDLTLAEGENDLARARRLRLEILRRRAASRAAGALQDASRLDFALLDRIAHDLQRNGEHELALEVAAVGRGLAAQARDEGQERWFLVVGAVSCVKLLDLEAAQQALEITLGRRVDGSAVEALAEAAPEQAENAAALRIRTLDACGRLLLAQGRSAAAEQSARSALRLASASPPARISLPDLVLRHAEVLLERGDFAEVERLRAEHETRPRSRRIACHWTLLRADSLILRGHLSDAEETLKALGKGPQPFSANALLEEARALRANVLGVLNRASEARQALRGHELDAEEHLRFERLLQGRESFMDGVGRMPVPMDRRPRPLAGNGDAGSSPFSPAPSGRRYESVRAEWAWRAGEVLLALDAGASEAAGLYQRVDRFAAGIDSPLICAKHALLGALVRQHKGDPAEAAARACEAAARLAALDLPNDELAAWQVVRSALLRGGARPGDDRLRAAREAIKRVLGTVHDRLHGADRVVALLNQWSEVDEGISEQCLAIDEDASGPAWRRPWRRRRLTRAALALALEERRWPNVGGAPPGGVGAERGAVGAVVQEARLRSRGASTGEVHRLLEVPRALLSRDQAVVVYVSLPDRLEMFLLTRSRCARVIPRVRAARGALWDLIRAAAAELHYRDPWGPGGNRGALERVAECLGLPELEAALPAHVTRVCVVPDDAIVHVPFAALPVGDRPFLQRWSAAFLPLAGWTSRRPARRLLGGLGVAVERSAVAPEEDLPHAALEVEAMRGAVPGTVWLAGAAASRENVLRGLQAAGAVHFSCHGRFDPEHPHRSALACADGWLTIEDIRRVGSPGLHLAVLGACWGARTFVLPGRELINLPVAFLDAGAEHAVASLWKIGDRSSADFARELYAGDLADPAAALRRAQLAWCRSRPPREWAPWVVYQRGLDPGRLGRGYLRLRRAIQGLARSFTS